MAALLAGCSGSTGDGAQGDGPDSLDGSVVAIDLARADAASPFPDLFRWPFPPFPPPDAFFWPDAGRPAASCVDGRRNGGEADVDCGGPCAAKCANGATCGGDGDCAGGPCKGGRCLGVPCPHGFTFDIGTGPKLFGALLGDLNGDGRLDVASAQPENGDQGVMYASLNQGGRQFGPLLRSQVSGFPYGAMLADLDGDGALDGIVNDGYDHALIATLGRGNGLFATDGQPGSINLNFWLYDGYVQSIACGDLNGDGWTDVASSGLTGSFHLNVIGVFMNRGRTDFLAGYLQAGRPSSIAVIDLNGDGVDELISGDSATGEVTVYSVVGLGAFAPAVRVPAGGRPADFASADFDGDGRRDLAVAVSDAGRVRVFRYRDGAFVTDDLPAGGGPHVIVAADLDGDGHPDLLVDDGPGLMVLFNRGGSAFGQGVDFPIALSGKPSAGDLDGDGRIDLALPGGRLFFNRCR